MKKNLLHLHRFLLLHSVYPIVLSTGLSLGLFILRVLISHDKSTHSNLVWNLFLAWIPYLCSIGADGTHRIFSKQGWMILFPGAVWLAFFPNAPYIVTDFLHLVKMPDIPLWFDILLLASFTWTGIFLAIVSLRTMQILVQTYLGNLISWIFVGFAICVSGLGIYLGRFERWNSWDLLTNPLAIFKDLALAIINPFDNLTFVGFTAIITAFLLVCYLSFISMKRNGDRDE